MMEQTDPEYVSYEMDIFWIQFGGGNPVELLDKYGDRWKLMHIKDMKKGIKKDLTGLTDKPGQPLLKRVIKGQDTWTLEKRGKQLKIVQLVDSPRGKRESIMVYDKL